MCIHLLMHHAYKMTKPKKSNVRDLLESISEANRAVSRERALRLADVGLTTAQAQIISVLGAQGPMSLVDLNAHLLTDVPPSRVVSLLVDQKFLLRKDRAGDRRCLELSLGAKGKKHWALINRIDRAVERWASKRIPKKTMASATKALVALREE